MAPIEDVVPIDHYSNRPHGTQVTDRNAPSSPDGSAVFISYADCVTVEAAPLTVISATSDLSIVDGVPVVDPGATYIELGAVGESGYLRLKRVRYGFMSGSAAFTVHQGELNVITDTPYTKGLDL